MSTRLPSLPNWLPESLRDDPKKTGILSVLVLVLLIVSLRYMLSGGPASANASVSRPSKTTVSQKSGGSPVIVANPQAEQAHLATRKWIDQPVNSVSRNLFSIRMEFYPSKSMQSAPVESETGQFWKEIEKSQSVEADQKKRRDILVENLQREAAKLRLQSTVMGPEPQAIIGGSLVKEGDVVASGGLNGGLQFRVLGIEARRVIIEREGIRLELRMSK
jgi:hypothetical protein